MKRKRPKAWYIRTVRNLRGPFSQQEFADACDMNQQTISDYEVGHLTPRQPAFRKMLDHYITWAKKYGVDPAPLTQDVLEYLVDQPIEPEETAIDGTEG